MFRRISRGQAETGEMVTCVIQENDHVAKLQEAYKMEIVIFFVFIAVCAFALVWASRKTKSETELARKQRVDRNKERTEKLVAPRDNLLAHNDQVWQSRRQHANTGVERTDRFVPKSDSTGTPEYDGYSRRDRHHVHERTAQIKEDPHEKELSMTAIKFDQDEEAVPNKAAS